MSCKTDCYDLCDADTAEAKLVEKSTGQASMHTEPRYTLALDSQSVAAGILLMLHPLNPLTVTVNITVWTFHEISINFNKFHRFDGLLQPLFLVIPAGGFVARCVLSLRRTLTISLLLL